MKKSIVGEDNSPAKAPCPKCGKPIATAERVGSLTSYLFQPFHCTCAGGKADGQPGRAIVTRTKGSSLCPDCGLRLADGTKAVRQLQKALPNISLRPVASSVFDMTAVQ